MTSPVNLSKEEAFDNLKSQTTDHPVDSYSDKEGDIRNKSHSSTQCNVAVVGSLELPCGSKESEEAMDNPINYRESDPDQNESFRLIKRNSKTRSAFRPESTKSEHQSLKEQSIDNPLHPDNDLSLIQREREESYFSMRSDHSVNHDPDDLQTGNIVTDQRKKPDSSKFSSVSMKSEQSMDYPYNFRNSDSYQNESIRKRPDSSKFSSVSMKSEQSMDYPYNFRKSDSHQNESIRPVSMKRGQSMDVPYRFNIQDDHADPSDQLKSSALSGENTLDSIFKMVEQKVLSLVKNELKRFKNLLSPEYSEEEVVDEENQGVREGALKITLHVLRTLGQINMATVLESKMAPWCQKKLKLKLKKTYQSIKDETAKQQNSTRLNEIYTELYITEGGCEEVRNDHEIVHIEEISRKLATEETTIKVNDVFKALPGQDKSIRSVMTKGVAGIGKTVSVQKFILDWSEGNANKDIHFIFPLPFRELNLLKEKMFSLKDLLQHFFTEMSDLALMGSDAYKILFIFDGLDECRLSLDFQNHQRVCNVTERTSVDVLVTNLIKGNMLPSALLWITSRPAACGQIPPECVDQVTEIRGFNDLQKEEYFKKRISDQSMANRIITHMKSSRSLNIMCHIPVFCWIAATVLETMLSQAKSGEIPKTFTQMFSHFLNFHMTQWSQKYHETYKRDPDQIKEDILALGKLAFQQLEKGNLIFYEEDLNESGIDAKEVSVYSGLCTQIFREETGLYMVKVYSFVHLSIQEFLAAVYVFVSFISKGKFYKNISRLVSSSHNPTMSDVLKSFVDKALQSENGHLDLFLRFLLGLSMESNQTILPGLLTQKVSHLHKEETVKYIKKMIKGIASPEKSINLFHCLNELNDHSLEQEVQTYLSRRGKNRLTSANLSPSQWSALVFVLLNSEKELEEFNLCSYDPSEECFQKLLPVLKASKKAKLSGCNLTEQSCARLASVLSSNSSVRELDLSTNNLYDSGVKLLSAGLENSHCKLQILRLCGCRITEKSCLTLAFTLSSNVSNLIELDLANNNLHDSGLKLLCDGLERPQCKLETLGLCNCNITHEGCGFLVSALKSNPSHLRDLNLGMNIIGDLGVKHLSLFLEDSNCKLEKLKLFDCHITEDGCATLASALKSNPTHLRELDLHQNKAKVSGVKLLSSLVEDPLYKLEKLNFFT